MTVFCFMRNNQKEVVCIFQNTDKGNIGLWCQEMKNRNMELKTGNMIKR